MWNSNSRELSETRAKEIFGDTNRLWDDSILNALQEQGVLIRQTAQEIDDSQDEPSAREEGHDTDGWLWRSSTTSSPGTSLPQRCRSQSINFRQFAR